MNRFNKKEMNLNYEKWKWIKFKEKVKFDMNNLKIIIKRNWMNINKCYLIKVLIMKLLMNQKIEFNNFNKIMNHKKNIFKIFRNNSQN